MNTKLIRTFSNNATNGLGHSIYSVSREIGEDIRTYVHVHHPLSDIQVTSLINMLQRMLKEK